MYLQIKQFKISPWTINRLDSNRFLIASYGIMKDQSIYVNSLKKETLLGNHSLQCVKQKHFMNSFSRPLEKGRFNCLKAQ